MIFLVVVAICLYCEEFGWRKKGLLCRWFREETEPVLAYLRAEGSGVTMGLAGWTKSRGPRVPGNFFKNNFPVTVKIRTSGLPKSQLRFKS